MTYGNIPPPFVDPPGFIPPPPDTHHEQVEGYNPFPGAAQANLDWVPPATAPFWPNQGPPSPSPWSVDAGAGWGPAQQGPWSPYAYPTPAPSWGSYAPATLSPTAPGLGQPIGTSPYLNVGEGSLGGHSPSSWDIPLEHTHSQDPPYPHTPWFGGYGGGSPLQQACSTGSTVTESLNRVRSPFFRTYPERYDSENLARRPKTWRPDYRRTCIPRIPRPVLSLTLLCGQFKDPVKRSINPILSYHYYYRTVIYELTFYPHPRTLSFPILGRVYNYIDFAQLATNPPVDQMRLFHHRLPWYIDVYKSIDNGVTVEDVIMQVYCQLQTPIENRDFYNEKLGSKIRERIARAYARRTQDNDEKGNGIRKVDYLMGKNILVGLVRTCDGLWEMKTRGA